MTAFDHTETHDEIVARLIVDRLVALGLLSSADAGKTAQRLSEGRMRADDWQALAENALEQDNAEGHSG